MNEADRDIYSESIDNEIPILLNCTDPDYNPVEHYDFRHGWIIPKTGRALTTIDLCKLYRQELIEERNTTRVELENECKEFRRIINMISKPLSQDNYDYRLRDFEKAIIFFDKYILSFPNTSLQFATMSNLIIEQKLFQQTLTSQHYKVLLNKEEQNLEEFRVQNS